MSPTDKLCYLNSVKKTFSPPLGNLIILILAAPLPFLSFSYRNLHCRDILWGLWERILQCVSWLQASSLFQDPSLGGPFSWLSARIPVGSANDSLFVKPAFHPPKAMLFPDPFIVWPELQTANSGSQLKNWSPVPVCLCLAAIIKSVYSSISFPVSMSMYPMSLISVYTILKDVHIPLYIYMDWIPKTASETEDTIMSSGFFHFRFLLT